MVRERVVEGMVVAYLYNIIYFASLSIDNNVEIYESQLSQTPLSNQAALLCLSWLCGFFIMDIIID